MHPKVLLDACAELVRLTLTFEHPADAVVSRFFRDNRGLGPRERATLAETVYTVLRKKLLFDHMAPSGSGPKERRLAILAWSGDANLLKGALGSNEAQWRQQVILAKAVSLAACRMPMGQIAAELGYSPSAFSAMVRKSVGQPPGRFLGQQESNGSVSGRPAEASLQRIHVIQR
jgi:AraC-like DNA-binding protein